MPLELSPPELRPLVSCTVPLLCKLLPLHPGYVMTVWAVMLLMRDNSVRAHAHIDERCSMVACVAQDVLSIRVVRSRCDRCCI
jgi:hypothetical protein